jgi:hypothetical protein
MAELSRAYARLPGREGALPESTEQLLFPWKRGDTPDRPLRLRPLPVDDDDTAVDDTAVRDTARVEGADGDAARVARFAGFALQDTGVFGALALKHWLEGPLQIGAEPIVDGWGGDRYELLVDDAGETLLFWRLLGDSPGDASQLARGIADRLVAAHGPDRLELIDDVRGDDADRLRWAVKPAPDERRFIRTTRLEHLLVERRGAAVVVILGLARSAPLEPLRDRLFALTVAHSQSPADDARRAAVARELEATLQETLEARPPPAPPSLHDQLVLPARTMALRVGAEARVQDGSDDAFVGPAGEFRWGVRPWLEVALPLSATAAVRQGPFLFSAGLAPRSTPLLSPVDGTWSARGMATVAAAAGDLGAVLQLEATPTVTFADVDGRQGAVAARAGLLLRPLPGLTLQPGLEWSDGLVGGDERIVIDGVRLGGVLQRGFFDAPLVELEVIGGLRLTATFTQAFAKAPPAPRPGFGLVPGERRVGLGLLLLF